MGTLAPLISAKEVSLRPYCLRSLKDELNKKKKNHVRASETSSGTGGGAPAHGRAAHGRSAPGRAGARRRLLFIHIGQKKFRHPENLKRNFTAVLSATTLKYP